MCLFICCCVVSFIFDRSWKKLISIYFVCKMLIYSSVSEFCVRNTTENFVLRDVGYRFSLSFLYSQKVVLFHGTQVKVIFWVPVRRVRPYVRRFSQNPKLLNSILCRSLVPNLTQLKTMKTENTAWNLLIILSKVWLLTRPICGGRQVYGTQSCLTTVFTEFL